MNEVLRKLNTEFLFDFTGDHGCFPNSTTLSLDHRRHAVAVDRVVTPSRKLPGRFSFRHPSVPNQIDPGPIARPSASAVNCQRAESVLN